MENVVTTILVLSFTAGITPGPLMALIISETLKHGKASGIKIALTPLLTDLPIMLVSIFILAKLAYLNSLLGIISLCGALYLAYLAYHSIKIKEIHLQTASSKKSFMKGVVANFLNPNPYIFYFSILAPLIVKGMKTNFLYGPLSVILFLGVFVIILISIVLSVHQAKQFFSSKNYVYMIRILGVVLFYFAFIFFKEGLQFIGLFK